MDMDVIMDFLKKWQKMLILCLVMLVIFFVGNKFVGSQKRILMDTKNQIAQLKSQQLVKKNAPDEGGLAASDGTDIGMMVDSERIDADVAVIETFAKKAFTFASLDEYKQLRKDLFVEYKQVADSDFFRYFYTDVVEKEDGKGRYDYLTAEGDTFVSKYKDISSSVVYMRGSDYTYVNHVTVSGDKGDQQLVFVCSVSADGVITGLQGYSLK